LKYSLLRLYFTGSLPFTSLLFGVHDNLLLPDMDLYHQVSLVRFVSPLMVFSGTIRAEDRVRSSQASFIEMIELLHVSMDACFRMGCFLVRFETDYGFVVRIHRHTIVTQQNESDKQLIYIKKKDTVYLHKDHM